MIVKVSFLSTRIFSAVSNPEIRWGLYSINLSLTGIRDLSDSQVFTGEGGENQRDIE